MMLSLKGYNVTVSLNIVADCWWYRATYRLVKTVRETKSSTICVDVKVMSSIGTVPKHLTDAYSRNKVYLHVPECYQVEDIASRP